MTKTDKALHSVDCQLMSKKVRTAVRQLVETLASETAAGTLASDPVVDSFPELAEKASARTDIRTLVETLAALKTFGTQEEAAKHLCVDRSAIFYRIKSLAGIAGDPLILRLHRDEYWFSATAVDLIARL